MTDQPPWLHQHGEDVLIDVAVVPKASRTRILNVYDDRLKIQLAAPPVDGKANDALVRFLADTLDMPRVQIEIVGGAASKRKTVRVKKAQLVRVMLKLSP